MIGRRSLTSPELNSLVAELCAAQHGVVAMYQLRDAGATEAAVRARVRSGRLSVFHAGVFVASPSQLTARGRAMAAVLAAGPGAYLSHLSAAWMHKLDRPRAVIHVVKQGAMNRRIRPTDGYGMVVVHSTRRLGAHEVTELAGIPVTTFNRTTIDLATNATRAWLDRYLADADREGVLHLNSLEGELRTWRGRRGIRLLRETLSDWCPATSEEMSEFEREFVGDLVAAGVPRPQVNPLLGEHLIDCLWPGLMLMFELDGHSYHRDPAAQTRDARRDRKHTLLGYRVYRFTRNEYRTDPQATIQNALEIFRSAAQRNGSGTAITPGA